MSEPRGAWARPRPSASRTPQPRSSTASPNPSTTAPKPSAPAPAPAASIWAERAQERSRNASGPRSSSVGVKGAPRKEEVAQSKEVHVPVNGFNDAEVREELGRGVRGDVYKIADGAVGKGGKGIMANGQSFFAQLGKQVAVLQSK